MSESPAIGEATPKLQCDFCGDVSVLYGPVGLGEACACNVGHYRLISIPASASPVDGATPETACVHNRSKTSTVTPNVVECWDCGKTAANVVELMAAASPVETEATPPQERESVGTMHDRAMAHADGGELLQAFHWEAMAAVRAGDLGVSDQTQVILMRSAANLARTIVDDLLKHAHTSHSSPPLFTREEILSLTTDRFGAVEKRAILEYGDARYTEALLELAEADSQVRSLREALAAAQRRTAAANASLVTQGDSMGRRIANLESRLAAAESSARSLREEREALQQAVVKYGNHLSTCRSRRGSVYCDCDFTAIKHAASLSPSPAS